MISVTLSQLTDILNGEMQGADITLDAVTTDTRKLTPGCLFVALKGERFDAHDFADQAKAGGAGCMISVTLSQLTDILNGELQGADITLDAVTTDTRKLTPGCLFVALKGDRFDAHDFADQAKAGGAGALLVSRPLDIDLPQLSVKDTRLAFGELAAWVRQQVPARVVALTGSSGKTSVIAMTAAI